MWNITNAVLYDKAILAAVVIATTAYAHCHPDVQLYIAKYTMLATLLDNFSLNPEVLTAYVTEQVVEDEPILQWFSKCMLEAYEFFLPHAADAIVISTRKWFNSLLLDDIMQGRPLRAGNTRFAEYRRMQSGDPEAYAFFIFEKSRFSDLAGISK